MRKHREYDIRERSFSALQRAENSSTPPPRVPQRRASVSVLFSEPKIPQRPTDAERSRFEQVSVLFSEPKIPQFLLLSQNPVSNGGFSALQRAENSST